MEGGREEGGVTAEDEATMLLPARVTPRPRRGRWGEGGARVGVDKSNLRVVRVRIEVPSD